jgi:hypothetical protein
MDIKEITRRMFYSFFVIFSGAVIAMYVYLLIYEGGTFDLHYITALLVMAVLGDLSFFIFYSKKELSRKQMLVRFAIHLPTVVGIMLCVAGFMDWIPWHEPVKVISFVALVIAVYVLVVVMGEYQSKKMADKLTQKLRERYKS